MIRYILRLTQGFRGSISISISVGIVRVISGLIFVALSKRAIDLATGNATGSLNECIAWLTATLIIELLCSGILHRTTDLSEAEMKNSLQARLFSRLLTATWTGKEKFHSGDSIARLTDDCRVISECLCRTLPIVIITVTQLIGAFLFLWYFSPILAITLMVILPLFMSAGKAFVRKMSNLTHRIRTIESHLQEVMQESLHHRILILACRQATRTIDTIQALHNSQFNLIRRRTCTTLYSKTAVFAGFESGYLIAFLWGIRGLSMKTISFGTMAAYLQLAGQIQRPLAELARLLPGLIQSHAAFSRIADIDRITTECVPCRPLHANTGKPVGLSVNNVTFSYPDGETVLDHFSHTFKPGSKTAVMGATGRGKSTLLLLALGLLRPLRGNVEVYTTSGEGQESEPVSAATRSLFVYVPQGNSLMSGTIRQNLLLGNPDASDEDMWTALYCAAADFVFDLKGGLDTICGEHGDGLSEGQAQRIAIARGLLQPGSILLLDEISAALDEETEKTLMKRLLSMKATHTIIFVTHHTGVAHYCDDVVHLA